MTNHADGSQTSVRCIVIAPNKSLSTLELTGLYCAGFLFSLIIATLLAWLGYWPILAFAVLEWLAIGVCVWAMIRSGHYREVVTISTEEVTVEKYREKRMEEAHFQRYWTRVIWRGGESWYPGHLIIESAGVRCEIGRCLAEEERRTLKMRLDKLIGPMNRMPDLVG